MTADLVQRLRKPIGDTLSAVFGAKEPMYSALQLEAADRIEALERVAECARASLSCTTQAEEDRAIYDLQVALAALGEEKT